MLDNLLALPRYRVLIGSLVVRELKARYRGSVLGFLWSFINPLLQLLIYWFVFSYIMPARDAYGMSPYALFLFTGILPWTWFSSSVLESSAVLIASGNLIKKILFPAEVLPIVVVVSNLVHFLLGLPILLVFLIYYGKIQLSLLAFPAVVLIQFVFTLGLCLFVSALAVHFRDVQAIIGNLMMLWFFASPVIYSYLSLSPSVQRFLNYNPMTHVLVGYHQTLFTGSIGHWPWLLFLGPVSVGVFLVGYYFFDRLRETFAEEV
ncbi:MAG TPA: ABC transporter permease [Vicinamibacteria bacterium]|nr:ABC transporter permease [Vicinamibacteria bacterium]